MLKIEKIKLSNKKYDNKKNFENKTFNKKIIKFVVYLSSIFTTILWILALVGIGKQPWYIFSISLILWFTVLFGNFSVNAYPWTWVFSIKVFNLVSSVEVLIVTDLA